MLVSHASQVAVPVETCKRNLPSDVSRPTIIHHLVISTVPAMDTVPLVPVSICQGDSSDQPSSHPRAKAPCNTLRVVYNLA